MIAFGYRKYTSLMHSVNKIMLEMGEHKKHPKIFLKIFWKSVTFRLQNPSIWVRGNSRSL